MTDAARAMDVGLRVKGLTLRYPYEVRQPEEYFDTIDDEKVPKDMLRASDPHC